MGPAEVGHGALERRRVAERRAERDREWEREQRAKEIVGMSEAVFQQRENERRAKEAWMVDQARLSEQMSKRCMSNYKSSSHSEEEEEEDVLAYYPSADTASPY